MSTYAPQQVHDFWPLEQSPWTCVYCGQGPTMPVHATRQAVTHKGLTAGQHVMHLVLCFLTGGLWIPVYIILALRGRNEVTRFS